ncbi:hypothetical protein [Glaciimonas immobilis]|uniref:Uncharacterized protein n=1 Tax=Glaciimonas immobilis TaxID=728004 RepID=A0A840RS40_9BURK|nr:hypothetical protein [Glaciimonas immobilis]KAF3997919.1 hypothetical protein HAV38_10095 [Glaciimonas immobilis]MBB5199421.1 hypothetical protein [Glaciimonas immobilis]
MTMHQEPPPVEVPPTLPTPTSPTPIGDPVPGTGGSTPRTLGIPAELNAQ